VGLNAGRLIDQIRLTYRQECDPVGDDGLDNHERITTLNANTGTGVDQLEFISSDGQRVAGCAAAGHRRRPGCAALGARTGGGGSLSQGALRAGRDSPRDNSTIGTAIE
jgi:hypothetical protein